MNVFFYGLFMDADLLREKGLRPRRLHHGWLKDHTLQIGERASLVPSPGERA